MKRKHTARKKVARYTGLYPACLLVRCLERRPVQNSVTITIFSAHGIINFALDAREQTPNVEQQATLRIVFDLVRVQSPVLKNVHAIL